ncbi:MAG: GFA family protein [Povalibacter sp.]
MSAITGRCFCGAVRYESSAAPVAVRACWCRDCQYLAAGNASVNAIFRTDAMQITGQTAEYLSTAESGNIVRRRFCPQCGTHMFAHSSARTEVMVVRVGTLDDREGIRPAGFIWTASAPTWAPINRELPCFEGQPPPVASR